MKITVTANVGDLAGRRFVDIEHKVDDTRQRIARYFTDETDKMILEAFTDEQFSRLYKQVNKEYKRRLEHENT